MSEKDRVSVMRDWLSTLFPQKYCSVIPLVGDASFRRYFRVTVATQNFIVMDAPPEKECCRAFVAIAKIFEHSFVRFPRVFAMNLERGFLLLSDFGDQQLLPLLNAQSADAYYGAAMDDLLHIQKGCVNALPSFDADLYWREFEIFKSWYLQKNLNHSVSCDDKAQLKKCYQLLIDSALAQPSVFVHRDYHARNIMVCDDNALGILDFQDAVKGPLTYDLVSLLRDCYIAWPDDHIEKWVMQFYQKLNITVDFKIFMRWFDWMGLQRHLKCLGIFSRLYYRDGKAGYLNDIPRVLNYAIKVCDKYPELSELKYILDREPRA